MGIFHVFLNCTNNTKPRNASRKMNSKAIEGALSEAATEGVQLKKLFLKKLQYSQENTCVRISFK